MAQDGKAKPNRRAGAIREGDIEPYPALRWVGLLFKAGAVFLGVAILAELVAGIGIEGWAAMPALMGEVARTMVLAVVLWGAGDMVKLLIHLGHDVRAERILLARLVHRLGPEPRTAVAAPAEESAEKTDEASTAEGAPAPAPAEGDSAAGDPAASGPASGDAAAGEEERGREAAD